MISLSTDFPGAAAENLRLEKGQVRFHAPRGEAPISMWWHFGLELDACETIECVWERTDEVLGAGGLGAVVPVYHDGLRWRRVPTRYCQYLPEQREFQFRVPCRKAHNQVAYCFPYTWEQLNRFVDDLADGGLVHVRRIGESAHGRPFRLIEFGHGELHVWIAARHHAGEMSGSYVLEGFVREALKQPALLGAATFHVAPAMDVDGVAEGLYGKDRPPQDFNRDYVSKPMRPEVAALMQAAEWSGKAHLYLDLHAPAPGDGTFLVPAKEAFAGLDHWNMAWQFGRYLEALAPSGCPCRVADLQRNFSNWSSENTLQTSTDYFYHRFGALSMTVETSYHRSFNGRLVSYRGWTSLGKALARAVAIEAGAGRVPDLPPVEKPESLLPRFRNWWCVHVPREVELTEHPAALEITGTSPKSYCWMMNKQVLAPDFEAGFAWRLEGTVEKLTVTVKGWDRGAQLPTGTWESMEVPLEASATWQTHSIRHREGAGLLMFRVEGLQGRLELRPAMQG
jgi:hypothetical protein